MPELPDLQAFSRNLTRLLAGKKIRRVNPVNTRNLRSPAKKIKAGVEKTKITNVERVGKELYFRLTNKNVLALHLMLRGELHFFQGRHDRKFPVLEIYFDDGTGLVVTDYQGQASAALNPPAHDGVDALSEKANYRFLLSKLQTSRAAIKNLLLDQHFIRGIGNAYADEILWDARISPFSIANRIPEKSVMSLARSIRKVLRNAEKSILKRDPDIISGEIRDFLKIHNPKKKTSPGGSVIRVKTSGGRKTYFTDEQALFR